MGIETILIVAGVVIVLAIWVGAKKARAKVEAERRGAPSGGLVERYSGFRNIVAAQT